MKRGLPNLRTLRANGLTPRQLLLALAAGLALLAVGFSGVRYFLDRYHYQSAQRAIQQANCATALDHFGRLLDAWRILDLGGYLPRAQDGQAQCLAFQPAVARQEQAEFGAALAAYSAYLEQYPDGLLAEVARERIALFIQAGPAAIANLQTCDILDALQERDLIPQPARHLPPFYLACGQVYSSADNRRHSFQMHTALLREYPEHPMAQAAEAALLENPVACEEAETLKSLPPISAREGFLPRLYYQCGQAQDAVGEYAQAYAWYESLLLEYPAHPLAAETEQALFANPVACERYADMHNTVIADRAGFLPTLLFGCGQVYQSQNEWPQAIQAYESFLAHYPAHALVEEAEAGLALSIVAQAQTTGAGEIPPPETSGRIGGALSEVVIQNESPERLRIVFSGPQARVEELAACGSCENYTLVAPLFCTEQGPIGRYTLPPGQYDVVVEAVRDSGTTPWAGRWDLQSGEEYYSCFFIVTRLTP